MFATDDYNNLLDILERNNLIALHKILKKANAVDIADFLQELSDEQALLVFRMLNKENALHVFSHLDDDMQHRIINAITDKEVAAIINDLWVDDAVDMLEEMPATLVRKVLQNSSPEARGLINQYLHYPENSAGRIMTAEYMDLKKSMTVAEALSHLKKVSHLTETIYTCFITDETRVLEGVLSLKDILLARDDQLVSELLLENPIYTTTTADQEEAAQLMLKYHLISMPVVDAEKRLVGIVTIDDAVDVLIEEDTEDFEKMAAMRPSDTPYVKTSVFSLAFNRFPWLLVSLATNIIISFVVDIYSPVYVAMPILVGFMPMLMGTGGNAGSQTSTLVIRGMAVGEIQYNDFFRVIWKELRVCLVLGLSLGVINFLRIAIFEPGQMMLALVVSLSLICGMFVGKLTGASLPMLAKALRFDPALMASPLITTIVDILAVSAFFTLAQLAFNL